MKKVAIKENPFVGFEQFALTQEQTALVVGGDGVASGFEGGGDGGGDLGGGNELQVGRWCSWYENGYRIDRFQPDSGPNVGSWCERGVNGQMGCGLAGPTSIAVSFHCYA